MRIDDFDNTLVCDVQDFQAVLSYFKDDRVLPEYIEISILKIILQQLDIGFCKCKDIKDYFNLIPSCKLNEFINDIDSMFFMHSKADYLNRYLSYLLYYLPANVFKVWKPLLDLQLKNVLKSHVRVLDIGTGPGSVPIGIIEYYNSLAQSFPSISLSLSFTLVDAENEFLCIADKMINSAKEKANKNLNLTVEQLLHKKIDENSKFDNIGKYDIITISNFLNVNEGTNYKNAVSIINSLKDVLEEDGSLIVIEPGDKKSSQSLKRIRNDVVNRHILNMFSPCIGIWEEKSEYNCHCFNSVRCFWKLPEIYTLLLNKGLHKAKRIDVPFNYMVLRKDNIKKYDITNNSQHYVKLVDLKKHHNHVVNTMAIIRTVIQKDDIVFFSLCDCSCEYDDSNTVWVQISKKKLKQFGIDIPLIATERIRLQNVKVNTKKERINLLLEDNTTIAIDY